MFHGPVAQPGKSACLLSRGSRVQILPGPLFLVGINFLPKAQIMQISKYWYAKIITNERVRKLNGKIIENKIKTNS